MATIKVLDTELELDLLDADELEKVEPLDDIIASYGK